VGVTRELMGLATGNGAGGGGEVEYDGRVAGINASAGEVGDMRAQRADRGWWETGGLDSLDM
jgi:hypothetical protein